MKHIFLSLMCGMPLCLVMGCSGQSGSDWYDQTVEHNQEQGEYIQDMMDNGMTAKEARDLHDRRVWEMNTINMSREGGIPAEYRENHGR